MDKSGNRKPTQSVVSKSVNKNTTGGGGINDVIKKPDNNLVVIKKNKSTPNFAPNATKDVGHQHTEHNRQFMVTHTSDNWKIRKAAKQAALEAQKKQEAERANQKAASETPEVVPWLPLNTDDDDPAARLTRDKILALKGRRQSADDDEAIHEEDDESSSTSYSDNVGAEDDDVYSTSSDTPGPSFLELGSDHFDTDLSADEDVEKEGRQKKRRNKTLQSYTTACAKLQMKPNQTFLRQCGRPSIDVRNRMLTNKDAKPIAIALVVSRQCLI
ncbi:hypothetical protein Btru_075226 [Bulinus truncatus]|nr:hypothetical protein Btru_075226 [Bulinus truncatus]